MQDYAEPYVPLILNQISPTEFGVTDDFDYNAVKNINFATDYIQLKQPNYVQLPTGLVKAKKASKMNFQFTPLKRESDDDDSESEELSSQSKSKNQTPNKTPSDSPSSSSSDELLSSQLSSSDDENMD